MRGRGVIAATVLAATSPTIAGGPADRVSTVNRYSGYSSVLYDGYQLTSRYIAMRDGTRIAIDIARPTLKGALVETKLPVVWMNTPYNRRVGNEGGTTLADYPGAALALVKYGYVVAVADVRGTNASFGKPLHSNRSEWSPWAYMDAYDVTEWLAAQPWSDSKVGMWGCSATGNSQWQAAGTRPPRLKAIFPMSAPSEYYDWNGVTAMTPGRPDPYPMPLNRREDSAAPVDADRDGSMLAAAREEHRYGTDYGFAPYRDSVSPDMAKNLGIQGFRPWLEVNTFRRFNELNEARIPAYETANFGEDQRVKLGVMVKLRNVRAPVKLLFAPGNHCNWSSDFKANPNNPINADTEELRWFDYWLKGVKNGIAEEPPVYLYTYNRPAGREWSFAWQWPLPTQRSVNYYFAPVATSGRPGNLKGALTTAAPTRAGGSDAYKVDYEVTGANRDERGMVYTTPAFTADTTLIGHPVIHLWVTSTATDGDFFGYMEDVGPDGTVTRLPGTDDGQLRASLRAPAMPPYDNLGLPYHRAFKADVAPLVPGKPAELVFDMAPISWVFRTGHHFRLVLTATAQDHHGGPPVTPVLSPAPTVAFLRDPAHASFISLPVNRAIRGAMQVTRSGGRTTARISFPPTLDDRYVADVDPASVTMGGTSASAVRVSGRVLTAVFPAAAQGSVTGRFGKRYDYGDLMTFGARSR